MKISPLIALCSAIAVIAAVARADAAPTPAPAKPSPRPVAAHTPAPQPTLAPPIYQNLPTAPPWTQPTGPTPVPTQLSLSDAESIALAQSPQLTTGRAIVDPNNAGIGIARSGYLPNLTANALYSKAGSKDINYTPFVSQQNQGFLELRQLIFDGGHVNEQIQAARYSTDAAKLTLLRSIQTVLLTVAQEYYAALQARHQLEAAVRSLEVAKVQEKLVEAQYRAGVASHADLLTAQLPVAQAQVTVDQAQNGEAQNVASLLTTMGLPANTPINLKDDIAVSGAQPKLDAIMDEALHERTDLAAAQAQVNSAQASVRAAQRAGWPLIDASAASGTGSTTSAGTRYGANWNIQANLLFPIYSGGLIRSEADQARALEQQAEANYVATKLNVYQNVQQSYLALATAASSLNASKVALDQARVVLDVTNAQYKAGVTTLPLLLNAQSQLTTAQSNYVQGLYAFKVAQQNLLFAEGTIAPSQ
ncbi:MAG: TolC family protein [Candidatus Eremiobacteraeota bacterium]|nr:TolC family protein [Candidatus Eremiobacteraeota bacterium]